MAGPKYLIALQGPVAELVDAPDLKSVVPKGTCPFDSGRGHHSLRPKQGKNNLPKFWRKPWLCSIIWPPGWIAFFLPNTQELLARHCPVLEMSGELAPEKGRHNLRWMPTPAWAVTVGALGFLALISITRVSEFLYWQF